MPWTSAAFPPAMISTIGFPDGLTRFPRPPTLLFNTQTLPITCPDTPIFTPTALGPPAEGTAMAGGLSAQAWGGRPSAWANGYGIRVSAGRLPATNPGVGLPTTMAAGSLTPLVADGFILPPPISDMEVTQAGVFRPSIRLTRSIGPPPPFSSVKMAGSVSSP